MQRTQSAPGLDGLRNTFGPYGPALVTLAFCFVVPRVTPLEAMPLGTWLYGLNLGLLTALVAAGMSLIYRTNRIINFAQADLGSLPATIVFSLMNFTSIGLFAGGLGYIVGGVVGVVLAAALGVVIERVIIRRFFNSPRLLLTVATIGLSQFLIFASLLSPVFFGGEPGLGLLGKRLTPPFDFSFEFSKTTFSTFDLIAAIVSPLCLLAITWLLVKTDVGIAVRAAADRSDRARLLGIPVKNLHTVIWAVAAVLSFTGAYLRAGVLSIPFGTELSLPLLVAALGALVIGKMENLGAVTVSAITLGILEQAVKWAFPGAAGLPSVAIAVVILFSLVVQRTGTSRRDTESTTSFSAAEEIRALPAQLSRLVEVRMAKVVLALVMAAAAIVLPWMLQPSQIFQLATLVTYSLIVLSVVVLTGWTGQISLGQMGFAAVGGVVGTIATITLGTNLLVALPIAGIAGALVAVLLGLPALRVRGLILAVITLAFSLGAPNYLLNRSYQDWIPQERATRPDLFGLSFEQSSTWFGREFVDHTKMYYFCLVVAVLLFAGVYGIRRSPVGRQMLAVRDNEKAAAAFATNIASAKLTAFALSGFLAAIGGCLQVHVVRTYDEASFTAAASLVVFTAAVVGGVTSLAGAGLGALYLFGGRWFLPTGAWQLLPTAVGVLVVLTVFPGGLGNLVYRVRDWFLRGVARRRGLRVPSLLGETPEDEVVAAADGQSASDALALVGSGAPSTASGAAPMTRLYDRSLFSVRGVDAGYGDIQVLFGVDLDVRQGEIIALLGTNGAGKTTLLSALTGLLPISNGVVAFDGYDVTDLAPEAIAELGIAQLPGGKATFGSLTVRENLRIASWQDRNLSSAERWAAVEEVLEMFPILRERLESSAVDLSGGQQQMLSLAMVFLTKPRLLLIDELSLGLAPIIVEQLMGIVRSLRDQGMTILLVEQSVNVALDIADRAYFMEKGQIRFEGSTAELMADPDIVRSVFFEGATDGMSGGGVSRDAIQPPSVQSASLVGSQGPAPANANWANGSSNPVPARTAPVDPGNQPAAAAVEAPLLALHNISVEFGGIRAVDNVSFEVTPGEVVGLIGPNGAGKTTLFDVISGFTPTVDGVVQLGEYSISSAAPHERVMAGIGRSFQDARLFGALTVEETIQVALQRWLPVSDPFNSALRLPAFAYSEARGQQRADDLIELLGLEPFRERFVSELSTGSRRVVDLACILALEPTIVLLDEPSSGIAQQEAEALVPLVNRIKSELGASVMVIEHDMSLITQLADRLVALESGRVIASGTSQSVLNDPSVVASYLGSDSVHLQRSGAIT